MIKRIIYALILTVGIISMAGCFPQTGSGGNTTGSSTYTVDRGDIRQEITPSGNLSMPNSRNLNFGSGGIVAEINVIIGEVVKQGQVLAKLDLLPLETSLLQAQIAVKNAQLALERAQTPTTSATGSALLSTPDPLDVEIKQLQLEKAKLDLKNAEKNLDNAVIKAPFDGIIGTVPVSLGDVVGANTTAMRIIDPKQVQIDAQVNEMDVYSLKIGSPATVQIDAMSSIRLPATVIAIAASSVTTSGVVNYPVKLQVRLPDVSETGAGAVGQRPSSTASPQSNPSSGGAPAARATGSIPDIKEGLTVTVNIVIAEKVGVIRVPVRAIIREGRNIYVQVKKDDGSIEKRAVKTGLSTFQFMEITDGLSEGEVVVVQQAAASTTSMGAPSMRIR